jgi:hypothetical protein
MIGQCKFCKQVDTCFWYLTSPCDGFGCINFNPQETLLESEIVEWMQFVKHQASQTAENIIKSKGKYIQKDDNCIQIQKENGDILIIPIDDDYLYYATNILDEFIGDADYNRLTIGDKIIFTFIRMSYEDYWTICEVDENEK